MSTRFRSLALVIALVMMVAACVPAFATNGRDYVKSIPVYDNWDEAIAAAEALNEELTGEGAVLLKNEGVLPLASGAKVTVFSAPIPGATSGGFGRGFAGIAAELPGYLAEGGFDVNPVAVNETNVETVGAADIGDYNVAIVLLARGGSEGSDLSVATEELANDAEENVGGWAHKRLALNAQGEAVKHGLMLSATELAVIAKAKETCEKVVVLLNTSNAIEMYNLNQDEGIGAIMFIGRTGTTGHRAVPKLLDGTLNPSGKTADIWYRDFTADPTWYNSIANIQNDAGSNSYISAAGDNSNGLHGVDYEEDIYLGYGYYESVYAEILEGRLSYVNGELAKAAPADAKAEAAAWYADNVVYPFGYGLSYTTFDVTDVKADAPALAAADVASSEGSPASVKTVTVSATVTNTGDAAGKKVVEVYSQPPYDPAAGAEKLAVKLVGYAKTALLNHGESQTLDITVNLQDIAYYCDTAEHDGVKGAYVLDAGDYILYAADNSHCYGEAAPCTAVALDAQAILGLDDFSGNLIQNYFSAENGRYYSIRDKAEGSLWADLNAFSEDMVLLSRADFVGTFPQAPVVTISGTAASDYAEFDPAKDYAAGDVVKVTSVSAGVTGTSSVDYYRFTADHAAGEFDASQVEALSGEYAGGLVFSDEFLALMAYYEEYNLETYLFEYPHFLAGRTYLAGDKCGLAGTKDVYEFTKDYVAPAVIEIKDYAAGDIFRIGDIIYAAAADIEVPDEEEDYEKGDYVSYNNRNYVVTAEIPTGEAINTGSRGGNVSEFTANNLVVMNGEGANVTPYNLEYLADYTVKTDIVNTGAYKYPDALFTGTAGENEAGAAGTCDVTAEMIAGWTQMPSAEAQLEAINAENSDWIWFNELAGIYYNSEDVIAEGRFAGMTGVQVWTKFMNQWQWIDIQNACWQGGNNGTAIANLGIPVGGIADSPTSFNGTYSWCCNTTIASTWNVELGYTQGRLTASLGLLKNSTNMANAKEQWLNPAVNTHRTPFSGRNNEYYSQDGMHAGIFAAAVAKGIQDTGVGSHLKHMFLNDQETNRNSKDLFAWVSEQAVRELYIKPFQMGIQEGGAEGAMSAFARLGAVPTPSNYNMCDELTRTEWGAANFFFHPDMYSPQSNVAGEDLMVRTGHNHAPGGRFSPNGTSGYNAISGHWSADVENPLTGAKGGVLVGKDDEATGQESYLSNNQWYIVRLRAMQMYSEYANQGHSRNGLLLSDYVGETFTAKAGEEVSFSVKYDAAVEFENYAVTEGELPEGLSLDAATGAITGTAAAGEYTFSVTATFDKWITQTNQYTIVIE